jgi:hypothetical protein
MFPKAKYTALVLFSALTFRILLLNIPYIVSLMTVPATAEATSTSKRIYKRKPSEYAQYDAKTDIQVFDVPEESIEDDADECFEKGTKYPSQLRDVLHAFPKVSDNVGLRSLAESFRTEPISKTYLSISVLRI